MRFYLSLISAAVISTMSCSAIADTSSIERITIEGDLRQKSLHQLAGSIAIADEQDVKRTSSQHLDDLLNQFASVNFTAGASRARYIQIRGIGERSEFVDTINPSVGVLIDGIDYSGLGISGISDIAQLEVFRGPEASRFGANAMAGMLNFITKGPSESAEGKFSASFANYDSYQLAGQFSDAINEQLGYSLSLEQQTSDGFMHNAYLNEDNVNRVDEFTLRFKAKLHASEYLTLELISHVVNQNNGYDAFSLDNNRISLSDEPGYDKIKSSALALKAVYEGFDFADNHMQLSWLKVDSDYGFDEDWGYVGMHPDEYQSFDRYLRARDQLTFDYRFISKSDTAKNDWVLGVYASRKDFSLTREFLNWDIAAKDIFQSSLLRENIALYGELTTPLSDQVSLVTGGRVERYDDNYSNQVGNLVNNHETMWGANISLNFQVNNQALVYLLASRGYKAGGVNGDALAKAQSANLAQLNTKASFEAETLYNAEFGVKASSLNQALSSRIAAFYMWRDNMQVKGWLNPNSGPEFAGFIDNAGSGRNYGLEMENRIQAHQQLAFFISASWIKTKLGQYLTLDGDDFTGREQAQAPRFQYSLATDWYLTENITLNVSLQGKDEFFYSDGHSAKSKRYELLGARLSYQVNQWDISLWTRNALNKDIGVRGFYFGNDPRDGYEAKVYEQFSEPRRFGASVSYQF